MKRNSRETIFQLDHGVFFTGIWYHPTLNEVFKICLLYVGGIRSAASTIIDKKGRHQLGMKLNKLTLLVTVEKCSFVQLIRRYASEIA